MARPPMVTSIKQRPLSLSLYVAEACEGLMNGYSGESVQTTSPSRRRPLVNGKRVVAVINRHRRGGLIDIAHRGRVKITQRDNILILRSPSNTHCSNKFTRESFHVIPSLLCNNVYHFLRSQPIYRKKLLLLIFWILIWLFFFYCILLSILQRML